MITFKTTLSIVKLAHATQRDKSGNLYWKHPKDVADRLKKFPMAYRIVALLHDTLEDTHITPKWLREFGYSEEIIEAVMILSDNHKPNAMTYRQWLQYILTTENEIAIAVKYADMLSNSSPARAALLQYRDSDLLKRYTTGIKLFDYVASFKGKYGFLKDIKAGDLEKPKKPVLIVEAPTKAREFKFDWASLVRNPFAYGEEIKASEEPIKVEEEVKVEDK